MVTVQVGDKCVARMCFATVEILDREGAGWYHDTANGGEFYLAHGRAVFPLTALTQTITECFVEASDTMKEQYGAILDMNAIQTHLRKLWIEACQASQADEFFHVNQAFDKLEDFVGEVGRACGKYAKCQVQGVYVFR